MPSQIAMLDGMGRKRRRSRRRRSFHGPVSIGYLGADGDSGGMSMNTILLLGIAAVGVWWFGFRKKDGDAASSDAAATDTSTPASSGGTFSTYAASASRFVRPVASGGGFTNAASERTYNARRSSSDYV